ncbi:MAG: tetratricopeptide repeat protein, partial [Planctomycetota bacterium]
QQESPSNPSSNQIKEFLVCQKVLSPQQAAYIQRLLEVGYLFCPSCRTLFPAGQNTGSDPLPTLCCPRCRKSEVELHFRMASSGPVQWEMLGVLGQGGFGKVLRVKCLQTGRTMALKVLQRRERYAIRRFLREMRISALLEHPAILPVYGCGYLSNGSPYLLMKEIRGGTLKDWMKAHQDEPDFYREGVRNLIRVCEALEYAHSQGVIHRDIKPSNIAISDFGEVLVMDWGIAKVCGEGKGDPRPEMENPTDLGDSNSQKEQIPLSSVDTPFAEDTDRILTQGGAMMGTPGYMSPEQARGEEASFQSDVYALGATLYELLVGKPPFSGPPSKRLAEVLMGPPVTAQERNPKVPSELSAIAQKCLEPDVNKRYQSVSELRQDLQRYLEGRSVTAKTDSLWEVLWKFYGRNSRSVWVAACVIFLFSLLWGIFKWRDWQHRRSRLEDLWRQAQKYWQQAEEVKPKMLEERWPEVYRGLAREPLEAMQLRQKAMEACLGANKAIEEALVLDPSSEQFRQIFVKANRRLGRLAMLGRQWLLAKTSFRALSKYKGVAGQKLMAELEGYRRWYRRKKLERFHEIWKYLEKEPRKGELEELAAELMRYRSQELVEELLRRLSEPSRWNRWQRRLLVSGLGRLGEGKQKWKGKDVVEWLLEHLKAITKGKPSDWDFEEVVATIWSLGRLKDPRSEELVFQVRWKAGQNSLLWVRTDLPYQWIPLNKQKKKITTAEEYVKRAIQKSEKNNYKGALEDLNQVIQINPKSADAYLNRGNVYLAMKQFSLALKDFNRAIQINPKYVNAYIGRGKVYYTMKQYIRALED